MFITINAGASVNIKKRVCKKIYNWNPATYSCKNGKQPPRYIDNQ